MGEKKKGKWRASGFTRLKENRMLFRMLKSGWGGEERWKTHIPKQEIIEGIRKRGDITAVEQALISAFRMMESDDPRKMGIGMKLIAIVERQNQLDEFHADDREAIVTAQQMTTTLEEIKAVLASDIPNDVRSQVLGRLDSIISTVEGNE